MRFIKQNFLFIVIAFILLIRYFTFLVYPLICADGPWWMSPTFSYMIGLKDRNAFAYDCFGSVYTVHFVDFIYACWFKIFELNTYSFISLEFFIIILIVFVWINIAKTIGNKFLIYLLIIGFCLSTCTYNFRPENGVVLMISLVVLVIIKPINENLKLIFIASLCVVSGIFHHIGGFFCVLVSLYYFIFITKNFMNVLKFSVYGICTAFLFTNGEIINYLLLPLHYKTEIDNHLYQFDFFKVTKFLIYSSPIPALVIYLYRKNFTKSNIYFLIFSIFLFSSIARSYYVIYLFPIVLFLIAINKNQTQLFAMTDIEKIILKLSVIYSALFLFLIPIVLIFLSPKTNETFRNIISTVERDKINWKKENNYFVPAELALEVVNKPNARLIFPCMEQYNGIQDVNNKSFYIYTKKQLKWIFKDFNTKNKKMKIEELVPESKGEIAISTIYKFKIKRQPPIGLWKVTFN